MFGKVPARHPRFRSHRLYSLVFNALAPIEGVRCNRLARLVLDNRALGHYVLRLQQPLQPADILHLHFEQHYSTQGFANSPSRQAVAPNGVGGAQLAARRRPPNWPRAARCGVAPPARTSGVPGCAFLARHCRAAGSAGPRRGLDAGCLRAA